jgi:NAD(P)H-dependent FMN reductase
LTVPLHKCIWSVLICGIAADGDCDRLTGCATLEKEASMSTKPKIALIIGSTRKSRFADIPAQWMLAQAQERDDMTVELVDLRDFDLPLFDEVATNLYVPSTDARAVAWQKKLAEFDGYIFVVAEYNRSVTGSLKNALDQAYKEWVRKPFTAMAYGSVGGTRAMEHLRMIGIELQMVPTRNAVHLGMGDFFKVHPDMGGSGKMADVEANLLPAAKASLDDLVWWAKATMAAKA